MLWGLAALIFFTVAGLGIYATIIEPRFRLVVREDTFSLPGWPEDHAPLRIVALADPHICHPWMPLRRLEEIVIRANALEPDVIVLLGDYQPCYLPGFARRIPIAHWPTALRNLEAPLGVFAILGNHDWWDHPEDVREALQKSGIRLLENQAAKIKRSKGSFWLAGTASMDAVRTSRKGREGRDDLPKTLKRIKDELPVLLLAHEPDMIAQTDARIAITLSGHTHGGQVVLPWFGRPAVPSRFGQRYAYGAIEEDGKHLLVSGGLGCSFLPLRFRVPPEINLITLRSEDGNVV